MKSIEDALLSSKITYADLKKYFKISLRDTRNLKDAIKRTIRTIYYKGYYDGIKSQVFHEELKEQTETDKEIVKEK